MRTIQTFGFYSLDPDYLEYLHSVDSEVFYDPSYRKRTKPFIGVLIGDEGCKYFIPLTSIKPKHAKWRAVSDEHFIIYELTPKDNRVPGSIYKNYNDQKDMHYIAVLDIKKMVPAPEGTFHKINLQTYPDLKYRRLLLKEQALFNQLKRKISQKACQFYEKQKETGRIKRAACNFNKLEAAMKEWIREKKKQNTVVHLRPKTKKPSQTNDLER